MEDASEAREDRDGDREEDKEEDAEKAEPILFTMVMISLAALPKS